MIFSLIFIIFFKENIKKNCFLEVLMKTLLLKQNAGFEKQKYENHSFHKKLTVSWELPFHFTWVLKFLVLTEDSGQIDASLTRVIFTLVVEAFGKFLEMEYYFSVCFILFYFVFQFCFCFCILRLV